MTDDQHGEGTPQQGGQGGWERLPQGDYDDGATTFVQLPEGGIDALLAADSPLAAPGHGYVPPQIATNSINPAHTGQVGDTAHTAGTDPSVPGTWAMPAGGAEWHDPNAGQPSPPTQHGFTYNPGSTGQWTFEEPAAPEGTAPGHDVTGEWSIPVAGGDLPDESGEFSTSALVEQWGGTPPATLPGGASAPWATEEIGTAWTAPPPPARTDEHPSGERPSGEHPAEERSAEGPSAWEGVPGTARDASGEPAVTSGGSGDAYAGQGAETAEEAPEGAQEPAGSVGGADAETSGSERTENPETGADAPGAVEPSESADHAEHADHAESGESAESSGAEGDPAAAEEPAPT
ncbi:(2Fe-2S)-binding protein, partial [Streptomyces sp. MB09-02B]|nr:(2Fe-2S)-binding protein [Streptomyces sp. MB09-02B]